MNTLIKLLKGLLFGVLLVELVGVILAVVGFALVLGGLIIPGGVMVMIGLWIMLKVDDIT